MAADSMAELRLPRPTLALGYVEVGVAGCGCGWPRAARARSMREGKGQV